jgi:hypothetical protein
MPINLLNGKSIIFILLFLSAILVGAVTSEKEDCAKKKFL